LIGYFKQKLFTKFNNLTNSVTNSLNLKIIIIFILYMKTIVISGSIKKAGEEIEQFAKELETLG